MSKFNAKVNTRTENLAGGEAYQESPKLKLVSQLLTSFVKDQYYRSEKQGLVDLEKAFDEVSDKKFTAKAAIFARTKFGMRSVSHVIAGLIAKTVKGSEWTKNFFDKVVHRVDDMTEILSYYLSKFKKPIPNSMKKGFKRAIGRFDEYQIAKYRGEGKVVSLVDLVNLIHPKPNKKNEEALKLLVNGELKSKNTWESKLTSAGQTAKNEDQKNELKGQAWKELILEKKIGYMALLKNLRNIFEQAPEVIDEALKILVDEKMIKKSLVLPFRFTTAIDEISKLPGTKKIIMSLNKAVDISLSNVPKFNGDTLVVLDTSGSMEGQPAKIGSLFSAVLVKSNECDFMTFSDDAKYQTLNPMDSTLTIANSIRFMSGGTNFHSIFNKATKAYDRIIILSDMQGWVGYNAPVGKYNEYCKKFNCKPFIYSFDLNGYGTLQFPESNIFAIAGFSDKIFDIMALLEQDKNALINEIEKIEI